MSIVSAALITKLADFGVRVCIRMGLKLHNGPIHRLMEKKRKELDEKDSLRNSSGR